MNVSERCVSLGSRYSISLVAEIILVMPKMGESVMEGTILSWIKQPGDAITADEAVLEVATDKVDTEVPAPQGGILKKILAKKGETVPVGQPIAVLESSTSEVLPSNDKETTISSTSSKATKLTSLPKTTSIARSQSRFYSPLVRSIAKKESISQETLDKIPGTGTRGRLTKQDLQIYLSKRAQTTSLPSSTEVSSTTVIDKNVEIIEMDRMRRIIASRMLTSKQTSPHVTSFVEADVTTLVNWRNHIKQPFFDKEGLSLTLTPIFVQAVARTLRDFPLVNVSVSGNKIIRHRNIHMGVAVALPTGNLLVPVLHNADQLSLRGLVIQLYDLVKRARVGELKADELSGGTYTISNVGSFGNLMGTPIIMQPQCAILAFGVVSKRAVVLTNEEGEDMIAIRQIMYLSHSYDHRVIDGALGGMFVKRVADYLSEAPKEHLL